jgi:hypothetical protein
MLLARRLALAPRPLFLRPSSTPQKRILSTTSAAAAGAAQKKSRFSYVTFAKAYPLANGTLIAAAKTSAADLVAQCALEGRSAEDIDWQRNALFLLFGAAYLGVFQYWYQVKVFTRLFPRAERFTALSFRQKLRDGAGLASLAGQTAVDLTVLVSVYLPAFYTFKSAVFSGKCDPRAWAKEGLSTYRRNFSKDAAEVVKVWGPADALCFSVPLYLRLPIRHIFSFVWTAYLSLLRGAREPPRRDRKTAASD